MVFGKFSQGLDDLFAREPESEIQLPAQGEIGGHTGAGAGEAAAVGGATAIKCW